MLIQGKGNLKLWRFGVKKSRLSQCSKDELAQRVQSVYLWKVMVVILIRQRKVI